MKKQKRKQSNRESARRSRLRKQVCGFCIIQMNRSVLFVGTCKQVWVVWTVDSLSRRDQVVGEKNQLVMVL